MLLSAPYYGWRMLRRGGYGLDFSHRFGLQKDLPPAAAGKKRVWIQAVSVGEIEAIAPLVDLLCESGKVEVVLTTTTSTGYAVLRNKYADKILYGGIFPFDFFPFSRSAWRRIKPDAVVLMESELWPEHLHTAKSKKVPAMLVNARMSDKSFRRYSCVPYLARRLLDKLSLIAVSGEIDFSRFISLGANPRKTICTGNLKFDTRPAAMLDENGKLDLRKQLGFSADSFVLLGSSTWPTEEEMLLKAAEKIRASGIDCRLLLVPRHAERRAEIIELIKNLPHCVRSREKQARDGTLVYLADTTGELRTLTQIADLAFIGKSLPPNEGGQSPIDCAASSVPMVYGSHMSNFRRICQTLEESAAAVKVADADAAVSEIVRLAKNKNARTALAESAKKWHDSNIGAAKRDFDAVMKILFPEDGDK